MAVRECIKICSCARGDDGMWDSDDEDAKKIGGRVVDGQVVVGAPLKGRSPPPPDAPQSPPEPAVPPTAPTPQLLDRGDQPVWPAQLEANPAGT